MDISNINLIIGIIVGIGTILGFVTGFFSKIYNFIRRKIKKDSAVFEIPKKSIIIVPKTHPNATWWHMGSTKGEPAMQISGDFTVTNITKYNILLTVAKMKKPKSLGHVMVKDTESEYHGSYPIPSGATTRMSVDFWIIPPFKEKGESFAADIAILDQFAIEHWIKKVEFKYR
jgi:hypothetical protein